MPKQLNVNLAFTADTHEAKAQLASLQRDLANMMQSAGNKSPLGITQELNTAIGDVNKLQVALKKATTSSGKLDLTQFRKELDVANLDAHKIAESLNTLGPEGQAAFAKLAQSVTLAEIPLKKVNNTLSQFATTLANTARWQISSSVLHGFMGALQGAYRYAQDLNKSLNSIRVVTGQSADQMAEFAKHANESAKALSATTTAYTDASLIFFQQGLTGDAVTERTDAVIKMSNVTGDSVEDVASYMTAIWNNFDDGSQKLEHFADVITALGASTAASSAEISQGLEKFASIADTVGLSYDYATSALATVVATTRQSADTVGTAFKTIFARIQGLKLGETLEDGVDLNKYSEALNAVGVQVLDLSGNMRNLDDILDDLAVRWKMLSSAQQTALAQTIAGTRQYNQLVALMSNWDFMEENLDVAKNAEGSLQKQADIYAESWEAAQKRVKAAWQEIYAQLLDDKFFINLTNNIGKILDQTSKLIDTLGGLKGIVPLLSTLFLKLFGGELSTAMSAFSQNLQITYGNLDKLIEKRKSFNDELVALKTNSVEGSNPQLGELYKMQGSAQNALIEQSLKLSSIGRDLTSQEQEKLKLILDQNNALTEQYEKQYQILQNKQQARSNAENEVIINSDFSVFQGAKGGQSFPTEEKFYDTLGIATDNQIIIDRYKQLGSEIQSALREGFETGDIKNLLTPLVEEIRATGAEANRVSPQVAALKKHFDNLVSNPTQEGLNNFIQELRKLSQEGSRGVPTLDKLLNKISGTGQNAKQTASYLKDLITAIKEENSALIESNKSYEVAVNGVHTFEQAIESLQGHMMTLPEGIVASASAISTYAMGLSSISGLINSWSDSNRSLADNLISTTLSLGMLIPMLASTGKGLTKIVQGYYAWVGASKMKQASDAAEVAWSKVKSATYEQEAKQIAGLITKDQLEAVSKGQVTKAEVIEQIAKEHGIKIDRRSFGEKTKLTQAIFAEASAHEAAAAATQKANVALLGSPLGITLITIAAVVAALTALVKIHEKYVEKLREENQAEIERVNKLQEEADANGKLVDSYIKAYNAYKESGEGKDQLASITDQLIEKYDLEGAALAKLTGNYDALTESIKNERKAELDRLIDETQKEINSAGENVYLGAGSAQNLNEKLRTGNVLDLGYDYESRQYDFAFDTFRNRVSGIDEGGSLKLSQDPKEILETYDQILRVVEDLEATNSAADLQWSQSYTRAKEWLKAMSEDIDEYRVALDQLSSYRVEDAFLNFNLNSSTSIKDLKASIESVRQTLGDSVYDLDKYIDTYLSGIEDISSVYQKYKLAEKIAEATETGVEDALTIIENYNDAQVAFLTLHLDLATLDGEFDAWMEEHQGIISQLGAQGSKFALESAMGTLASGGSLTQDVISDLFGNELAAGFIGIEQSSFNALDASEQLQVLTNAWIENTHSVVENKDALVESLRQEQKEYTDATDAYTQNLKDIQTVIDETKEQGNEFDYTVEQIEEALLALDRTGSFDALRQESEELANIAEAFNRLYGEEATSSYARVIANNIQANKEGYKAYNDLEEIIREVANAEFDYADASERIRATEKLQNAEIDEIQKNYQSLKSAVDDYNKSGVWSMDNVQALIEMEDEYVAALDITEDGIVLNTNALQKMTITKLNELEASVDLEYQTKMLAIAEKEESYAAMAAAAASVAAGSDFLTMGENALTAAEGVAILEETLNALGDRQGGWADLAEQTEKAWEARKAAIQDAREAALAGGDDFDELMKKSSKSGGGGSKDVKELKEYIKEFDKLYPIKKALEDLADAISDLDKKKSHLMGQSLVESLQKENELLSQQRDLYEELLRQQGDYRNELAGALQQFGATFDSSTGNLTNYLEITQAALDKYNAAVDAYNSSHDKGAFSVADQEYKYFKEVLSAYQTILTDMTDTQNKLDDNFLQQIENNLKSFETEIKVDLDFDEAQRKVNNFFKDINSNFKKMYKSTKEWAELFTTATKNVDTYTKGEESTIETDLRALQEVASFIDNKGYDNDDPNRLFASRDDAIAKYKELSEQLMSDAQDLYELYEDTWNNYLDAIDEVKSQWNDILKGFDRVNSTLKHYEKVAELLYGGSEYATGREYLDQIYAESSRNSIAKQDALRKEIDALREEYDQILSTGVEETDEDLVKLKEAIQEAESSLEGEIENYLSTIQSQLTNSIKSIMDTANRNMTRGHGVDLIIERWNDAKDAAEGYYDEVERVYELEKLESEWEDVINSTSTLKNQQYLTSIMNEQLKNLRDKTKLSEYDIGLAEKELAIYQAQMALEDARNNKNAMKVVRNERGDWAYQYVADEDDVASKEEDLMNKTYEKYEYVKNASNEATEALLQLYQTAQERLSELLEEYKYADEARRLEIAEQYNYLYDYYYGPEGLIIQKASETHAMEDDLNIAGMELVWELYEKDIDNYSLMTESEKALIDDLRDHNIQSFTELVTAVATGDDSLYNQLLDKVTEVTNNSRTQWQELAHEIIGDWATNPDSVRAAVTFAYDSIMDKVAQYDLAIALSEQISGIAWTNITARVNETEIAIQQVESAIWNVIDQTSALSGFRAEVDAMGDAWISVRAKIMDAVGALQGYLSLLGQASQVRIPEYNVPLNPTPSNKKWQPEGNTGGGGGGGSQNTSGGYIIVGQDAHGHDNALISNNGGQGYATWEEAEAARIQMSNEARGGLGELRVESMGYQAPAQSGVSQADINRARISGWTAFGLGNVQDAIMNDNLAQLNYSDYEAYMNSALAQAQANELSSLHGGASAVLNSPTSGMTDVQENAYINIQNLDLPNVTNYTEFIEAMQAAADLYKSWEQ